MIECNKVFIEDELVSSYLNYAMSVIVGRALPDVRDGLKPVHRRILFVMKEINNTFNGNYKKSARIVGEVIGKYHPHGETAVYDSIVRLSQPFVQRYVLIDGQGNFGSIDGDSPAAMRYTEVRMSEFADFLLKDLDYAVVDFIDNYDCTEKQPVVLPAMVPNLLINGSCGIAVGMATNIPPHNLCEIIDACLLFLDNFDICIDDLISVVLAPDFPTAGVIYDAECLSGIYKTGKGKFLLRANTCLDTNFLGETVIVIDELPYQVNKSKLIESIVSLVNLGILDCIKYVRDESDKDGLRIIIELQKKVDPNFVLDKLFLHTKMQISYNVNMVALVDNYPRLLNLKDFIKFFIDHRYEVIYRRTKFNLDKAERRIHLLEGLCVALFNLDDLVKLIVNSSDFSSIIKSFSDFSWNCSFFDQKLDVDFIRRSHYVFSDVQIQFILDIKIGRLTRFERNKLIEEYVELFKSIKFLKSILYNESMLKSVIKDELLFVKSKFGDKRKTRVFFNSEQIGFSNSDIEVNVIFIISELGYFKSFFLKNLFLKKDNKKLFMSFKVNDSLFNFFIITDGIILLCFSSLGKIYKINSFNNSFFDKSSWSTIFSILKMSSGERVVFVLSIRDFDYDKYVFMVTKRGVVRKVLLKNLEYVKECGVFVIDLLDGDLLVDVKVIKAVDDIMLFSKFGKVVRFSSTDVKCFNKKSRGVLGIKLSSLDCVVSLLIFDSNFYVVVATENGYVKKTKMSEYSLTKRGAKGIICISINSKNGCLIGAVKVLDSNGLLFMSSNGIISKLKVCNVLCVGRSTVGTFLVKLQENEKLIGVRNFNLEVL